MGDLLRIADHPRRSEKSRPPRPRAVGPGDGLSHAVAGQRLGTAAELGEKLGGRSARQIYDDRQAGMPAIDINRGRGRPSWRYPLIACLRWYANHSAEFPTGGNHTHRRSA